MTSTPEELVDCLRKNDMLVICCDFPYFRGLYKIVNMSEELSSFGNIFMYHLMCLEKDETVRVKHSDIVHMVKQGYAKIYREMTP